MNYLTKPEGGYYKNKEWYTQRNQEMYEDKIRGEMTNAEIIGKYGVSLGRIAYKVNKERAKHGNDVTKR